MQFVFCILFFKQIDAFEKVFSKCFNKFDVHSFIISNIRPLRGGGGQVVNAQIMHFISSPIFLRLSPSDLPVVLMILREKKSKSEPKGPEKKVNKCGKLGLTAWGDLRKFVVLFIWNYHYSTLLNRTKGRN